MLAVDLFPHALPVTAANSRQVQGVCSQRRTLMLSVPSAPQALIAGLVAIDVLTAGVAIAAYTALLQGF